MKDLQIGRLSVEASGRSPEEVQRLLRRALELLGKSLAGGDASGPAPRLSVVVSDQPGLSEERLAEALARQLRGQLL